jgi:hypothetical protein
MSAQKTQRADYRYAKMSELGTRARRALKPAIPALALLLGGVALYQISMGRPGGIALALIALGACISLAAWRASGKGLPLMPVIVLQHVIIYALPLVVMQETVSAYPQEYITQAGIELLIFFIALTVAWRMGMQLFPSFQPVCYGLQELKSGGTTKLARIGFGLIIILSAYQIFERTGILLMFLSMLPSGVFPIVWAVVSAAGTCGFFIGSLLLGGGSLSVTQKAVFWLLLAVNCYIESSSFLLSPAFIMIITVMIGLFWSTGRFPWIYFAVVLLVFSYLNIGKIAMRERHWGEAGADEIPQFSLAEMPGLYGEWFEASYECMVEGDPAQAGSANAAEEAQGKQSLLERINNMQNLLFVIDAVKTHHIEPLGGKTYSIIPALLIPRFLWPDKPGTHEGQVMLNVHFGRQDVLSTTTTYVAWGLLPEAYGNFGAGVGAIFLGAVLGLVFAWVERYTADKLVISMEGFLAFTLFLAMANSFELVASVLVTSVEQAFIPIIAATAPFARRIVVPRASGPQQ